jgi:aspartate beta-hydroxylase/beta-hydroxylase
MDYHPLKARLNRYLASHVGGEQRPTFYEIDRVNPALNELTRNFESIRTEFERLLDDRVPMPAYHELDAGETPISDVVAPQRRWNVYMLYILGYRPARNRARCPRTCALLERIPDLVQAFFSVLEPHKPVPRHEGPYLGYLRYHLGLCVPERNPPQLIVNGQPYTWRTGEAVLFDDSWPHEVVNRSDGLRAVLIVDVLRPLPPLPAAVNRFVTQSLMRPLYARAVARKAEALARRDLRERTTAGAMENAKPH